MNLINTKLRSILIPFDYSDNFSCKAHFRIARKWQLLRGTRLKVDTARQAACPRSHISKQTCLISSMSKLHLWIQCIELKQIVVESHNLCKKEKLKNIHTYTVFSWKQKRQILQTAAKKAPFQSPAGEHPALGVHHWGHGRHEPRDIVLAPEPKFDVILTQQRSWSKHSQRSGCLK